MTKPAPTLKNFFWGKNLQKRKMSAKKRGKKKRYFDVWLLNLPESIKSNIKEHHSINLLSLPTKLENALYKKGYWTIGEFLSSSRKDIRSIKNVGDKSEKYLFLVKKKLENILEDNKKYKKAIRKRSLNRENKLISKAKVPPKKYLPAKEPSELFTYKLPPSLKLTDSIAVLGLLTRLENTLINKGGVITIGDFCRLSGKEMKKIRNIGGKSEAFLLKLSTQIKLRLKDDETEQKIPAGELLNILLSRVRNTRLRDVILRRYGLLSGDKETLEEIGKYYRVTRERIRQLQVKAIKKIRHPSNPAKKPILELFNSFQISSDYLPYEDEADKTIPVLLKKKELWGSSFLNLLSDLNWIKRYSVGGSVVYSSNDFPDIEKIFSEIIKVLSADKPLRTGGIVKRVNTLKQASFDGLNVRRFVNKYCLNDPRVKRVGETESKPNLKHEIEFMIFERGHGVLGKWTNLMTSVLEEEGSPLHFTEISNRVNDLMENTEFRLDHRRAHSILIEKPGFAHSGRRGTYGLTKWGIRKSSTLELSKECLEKAGFPLHWKQIYYYVGKYKDTRKQNITALLSSNKKFVSKGRGIYWLRDK